MGVSVEKFEIVLMVICKANCSNYGNYRYTSIGPIVDKGFISLMAGFDFLYNKISTHNQVWARC